MPAERIRPLAELRRADARRFGGKSASLGELIAAGVPVPPGFAVASDAYREFVAESALEPEVERALAGLDPDDLAALRAASGAISDAVRARPLPAALRAGIVAAYGELASTAGESEPAVAVRSSALGEDAPGATFAGQQESTLSVRGADAVCDALRACWASLHSAEAISYRARMDRGGEAPAMGATVQLMVDAAVSGVMFTCNPVSGDPSSVSINASWGLGEAVVGGEVTPDEYRLSKVTGELLRRSVSSKQTQRVPRAAGGTARVAVPDELRDAACLDDERLALLLDVARRVERHFGCHQDIEWAIARAGLFVLQSRPVTTAPRKAEPPGPKSALALVMDTFGAGRKRP